KNLDVLVGTDAAIITKGIYAGTNTCAGEPWSPVMTAAATFAVTGVENGPLVIPMLATHVAWSNMYHIHCDGLSRNSKIEIILAVIAAAPPPFPPTGEQQPRGKIKWAKLEATLNAGPRQVTWHDCRGDCSNTPMVFPGEQQSALYRLVVSSGPPLAA